MILHRLGVLRRPRVMLTAFVLLVVASLTALHFWARYEFQSAREALHDERIDDARRHLSRCRFVWRRSADAHRLAARIERNAARYEQAEAELVECRRVAGKDTEAEQLEWTLLRAQRGEIDDVAPGLWMCVEAGHPDSEEILATLARRYLAELRFARAIVCLDRWLDLEPDSARALDWRGWVLERQQRKKAAADDYLRALEIRPGRKAVRLRLIDILLERNDVVEALPHVEFLRRADEDDSRVLVAMARCRVLQANKEEARRLLDGVLALEPENLAALVQRATLDLNVDPAAAEIQLFRANRLDRNDIDVLYNLFLCFQAQGKSKEAAGYLARHKAMEARLHRLQELLGQQPGYLAGHPDQATEAAEILFETGQERPALYWLHVALAANAKHPAANRALADYYDRVGQPEEGERHRRLAGK